MKKIASQVKLHTTKLGKITHRHVFTVEVLMYVPDFDIMDIFSLTDEDLNAVNDWVVERDLGTRMSYNTWKLRDNAAVTMFLLRWN